MLANLSNKTPVADVFNRGQKYWLKVPSCSISSPEDGVVVELLYRDRQFQIERITMKPNHVVPLHRHPNVDSYEFPLWGSGEIWLGNHHYKLDDTSTPWRSLFISRHTWHGGLVYDRGGAFLSVQFWSVPITGTIATNWEDKC